MYIVSFPPSGKGGNEIFLGTLEGGGMTFFNIRGDNSKRGEIKPEGGEWL